MPMCVLIAIALVPDGYVKSSALGLRTGDDQLVGMVASVVADLNEALNEATVAGLRLRPDGSVAVLLHVLALPEAGPADPDTRRALILSGVSKVLSGVSKVRVLLRRERPTASPRYGPAIPLADSANVIAASSHVRDPEMSVKSPVWGSSVFQEHGVR
ncbi:hypothetical protein [Amycolatopsis sp. cg9]|uniref:hypothetical protein n=1 Tax=Amycolatopsis sp. cg9 TaxID=3238801 RepID=UPI003523F96A